jgi:hypothetical protein
MKSDGTTPERVRVRYTRVDRAPEVYLRMKPAKP